MRAAEAPPPADAAVFAEGVRATLPPTPNSAALLQPGMPRGCPRLAPLEGPTTLPGNGGGQAEAERAKPTLPGACPEAETLGETAGSGSREGHPYQIFFRAAATAPVATSSLIGAGDLPCNGSARGHAGELGSASGSGNGAGGRCRPDQDSQAAARCPLEAATVTQGTGAAR
jgi:hypothetical protein